MKFLFLCILFIGSFLYGYENSYQRANNAANKAFESLDCEFEDCHKQISPKTETKIIIKEVIKEKPVYIQQPRQQLQKQNKPNFSSAKVYNKAFFDLFPKSQAPILEYLEFPSFRTSFDINHYIQSVLKIKERGLKVKIYGKIEVPQEITHDVVYVNSGEYYNVYDCCDFNKKIYFNGEKEPQKSDIQTVTVKKDRNGHRYIDYTLEIYYENPQRIRDYPKSFPNTIRFSIAPKVRDYQNKFLPAKIYIIEE